MTAETLKPFITSPNMENLGATRILQQQQRQRDTATNLAIIFSFIGFTLAAVLLGFTLWNSIRVAHLQTEVGSLQRVIESMQNRLGLHYLDDLNDIEKDYNENNLNTLPDASEDDNDDDDEEVGDDLDTDDDDDDDDVHDFIKNDDEYDDYDNYEDLIEKMKRIAMAAEEEDVPANKKHNTTGDEDNDDDDDDDDVLDEFLNGSEEDNLYVDFEKYKEEKAKKRSRKARSIDQTPKSLPVFEDSLMAQVDKSAAVSPKMLPTLRYDWTENIAERSTYYKEHKPKRHIVPEDREERRSRIRTNSQRSRRLPYVTVKSGDSVLSAKNMERHSVEESARNPAAHFHLKTRVAHRNSVTRPHGYDGDMYIGHLSWTNQPNAHEYFVDDNGGLNITEPGLYYIYAQVTYQNKHDHNGFIIFHGDRPFLHCLQTVPGNLQSTKIHTCHTSGLIELKRNDRIHLRDYNIDRDAVLMEYNAHSFFGLMKI